MQKLSCLDFHMTVKIILPKCFSSSGSSLGPGTLKNVVMLLPSDLRHPSRLRDYGRCW